MSAAEVEPGDKFPLRIEDYQVAVNSRDNIINGLNKTIASLDADLAESREELRKLRAALLKLWRGGQKSGPMRVKP